MALRHQFVVRRLFDSESQSPLHFWSRSEALSWIDRNQSTDAYEIVDAYVWFDGLESTESLAARASLRVLHPDEVPTEQEVQDRVRSTRSRISEEDDDDPYRDGDWLG